MGTKYFLYSVVVISVIIATTNANLSKILSDGLVRECQKHEGNSIRIQRCLKNEIKKFCGDDGDNIINGTAYLNEVDQTFCNMMENGKKNRKYQRRLKRKNNRLIPSSVKEKCLDIDGVGGDSNTEDDCIQTELGSYCGEIELNSTDSNETLPFDTPICSCYNQHGRRNMKQCIKEQKQMFCLKPDNNDSFECKRMNKCGSLGRQQFRACVKELCNEDEEEFENFECQKMRCVQDFSNRKQKRKCFQTLCNREFYADEPLCLKLKDKASRKINRKMLRQVNRVGKRSKSPIPRLVKKMCRDEEAEEKDDCILHKLEETCQILNNTVGTAENVACECVGNTDRPTTIDGLRSCVKSYMISYCQDENINDIEKAFECKKVEQCEAANDGNRLGKRQCIKKLCKEKMFADTCHCKKGRRERKKCFKTLGKDDL